MAKYTRGHFSFCFFPKTFFLKLSLQVLLIQALILLDDLQIE